VKDLLFASVDSIADTTPGVSQGIRLDPSTSAESRLYDARISRAVESPTAKQKQPHDKHFSRPCEPQAALNVPNMTRAHG